MIGLLLAMYPARWRQRYGEEFRAVLESRPLGPFDVADVLIGALDARLTRRQFAGAAGIDGGPLMMLRIGGFGAIAGGILWFARPRRFEHARWRATRRGSCCSRLGTVGLLLALIGLSAFQAHRDPMLAWAAFAIPGIGARSSRWSGSSGWCSDRARTRSIFGSVSAWSVWVIGLLGDAGRIDPLRGRHDPRGSVLPPSRTAARGLGRWPCSSPCSAAWSEQRGRRVSSACCFAAIVGSFAASWIALGSWPCGEARSARSHRHEPAPRGWAGSTRSSSP